MEQKEIEYKIESMIDSLGFGAFLAHVAKICSEKSDHVQENWQDSILAKEWERASIAIDKISFRFQTNL